MLNHISGAVSALDGPPPLVRAGSVRAGKERRIPITPREVKELIHHAEELDAATRQPGCTNGIVGKPGLAVLRVLGRMVNFGTGELCPDHNTLATETGYSRRTVSRALRKLQAIGFVEWSCRYIGTGRRGFCPQVKQVSNGYRLCLPARIVELVARLPGRKARAEASRAERHAERQARAKGFEEVRARLRAERQARAKALADAALPPPDAPVKVPHDRAAQLARFQDVLSATGLFPAT